MKIYTFYLFKIHIFFNLILISSFSTLFAQNSGIVWEKELISNFDSTNSSIIFQGITTDSFNNIYFCQGSNNVDTTSSIISKYSPTGELLWRRTLLPNNQYQGIYTQFDYSAKIYIDKDENLVFCAKGYDDSTGNILLLFKFDLNGNLLSKSGLPLVVNNLPNNYTYTNLTLLIDKGNIYFPIYTFMVDTGRLNIYGFDKDFNHFTTKTFDFYKSTHGNLISPSNIQISIQDSFLTLITCDVNPDYTEIKCINLNTNQTLINYTKNSFNNFSTMFKKGNYYLLTGGNGIIKFDSAGSKIFEYNNPSCYNFNLDKNYINFTNVNYSLPLYLPISSTYNCYNIFTDSIYTFSPSIPQVISPISYLFSRKGNYLYSSGYIQDDTVKLINGIKTIFFSKLDILGNTIDYYLSTITNPGWAQNVIATCIDKDENIVAFKSVLKPADSSASKTFYYIIKGSFNRVANLNGTCYFDENNNCIKDSNELIIPNNIIHLLPEDIYTTTDSNGKYSFSKLSGNATLKITPINDNLLCDSTISVSCSNTQNIDTLDFGYKTTKNLYCKASIHNFISRPGFYPRIYSYITNKNLFPIYNVQCSVLLDSAFQYINSNLQPDSLIGNRVFWHLDSLKTNDFKQISIITYLPPSIPLGYNFMHQIQMETQTKNNRCKINDSTIGITVGSYDPNDKTVEPKGKGENNLVSNNSTLKYTIRFQNTGTDTAFNIKIIDEIDNNLDLNSFKIIATSHPMIFKFDNRIAKFYFNNIHLIDSNKSQDLSNGFIEFSINPKQNIDGTKIFNKADIYFDYNTPIATNTTYITIGEYIAPKVSQHFNLTMYPNPNKNEELNIKLDIEQNDIYTINITDFTGRIIYPILSNSELSEGEYNLKIKVNQLTSGMYFISLKSKKHKYATSRKLFVIL